MPNYELIIQNDNDIYYPVIKDNVTWETTRQGVPGKLEFTVIKDQKINFQEGNAVRFKKDNKNIFYGFVFKKQRDKEQHIKVTCYDQLRYFKNKDLIVYENKTASEVLKMLTAKFQLKVGEIEDTKLKIESRVEKNKTLFDIVEMALAITTSNTKRMYVLYDDFGKLSLKNIESMKLDVVIDDKSGENFDYTSSIDNSTYNQIKLVYVDDKTSQQNVYISKDTSNINKWGVLQYFDTIEEKTNGKIKADTLLSLYNRKTRSLSIKKAFGDIRVRGGSIVAVMLNLGDIIVQNYMLVDTVKHTFGEEHYMDIKLVGGDFVA